MQSLIARRSPPVTARRAVAEPPLRAPVPRDPARGAVPAAAPAVMPAERSPVPGWQDAPDPGQEEGWHRAEAAPAPRPQPRDPALEAAARAAVAAIRARAAAVAAAAPEAAPAAPARMARPAAVRRDPAPSRWSYRMQRLMLTPVFRVMLRLGLPTLVTALVAGIYLADADRRAQLTGVFTDLRERFEQRPEFMVALVSVEGASPELAEAVRARLALPLPQSSFDIDLDAARLRIEELDAVKSAELRVRSGGVLQVMVTERQPVLVWRADDDRLELIDDTGHRVASLAARTDRPDLPLVAGAGADLAADEALEILAAAQPLLPRLRGLVRMGERRWDVVLDRDQRILLPEAEPVRAVERLLALDAAQDILNRDVLAIDLRNDHRPTLRLALHALNEQRIAQGLEPVENDL